MLTPVVRQFTSRRTAVLLLLLLLLIIPAFVLSIISTASRSGAAGVSSLNGVTGDLTLLGGTGISITGLTITNDMTVALVEPVEFIVSGSPIDGNGGTITVSKANQVAHSFWGGPVSGSPAVPTFRSLVSTDIPSALSLTTLSVSGDTLLGANTSCVIPLLPSCYDISNQQCIGGPLANNCLPPNAAFDNLVVGTLTVLNGTSNGTSLNNTFLGDTFLNGSFTCVGSGSISNGCLNLGGYTCPMGMPLAESCIPASLVMYDVTVTNNLTVNTVTCAGGPLPGNCFSNLVVLDNLASPNYPTSPQTEGIWYGTGAKAGTGTSSSIGIGHSITSNVSNTIAIGSRAAANSASSYAIGEDSISSGGQSIAFGAIATATGNNANAIGAFSLASSVNSVAYGFFSASSALNTVAVGVGSTASGINSIAVGLTAVASNGFSIAIGAGTSASGDVSIAIGGNANAGNNNAIAIGFLSVASGLGGVACGLGSSATGSQSSAYGLYSLANADNSIAIGNTATASGISSVAIGSLASTSGIATSIILSARNVPMTPIDTAHAFALGINTASVNPGTLGITVNNAPYQLPLYTSDFATTGTTGGVTAFSVTSAKKQFFTGTSAQTVTLPNVATLAAGFEFKISNLSTGAITVNAFNGALVATLAGTTAPTTKWGFFTCVDVAGVGAAGWAYDPGA